MRKFYSEPVLDVTTFAAEDVIMLSNGGDIWDMTNDFYPEEV